MSWIMCLRLEASNTAKYCSYYLTGVFELITFFMVWIRFLLFPLFISLPFCLSGYIWVLFNPSD